HYSRRGAALQGLAHDNVDLGERVRRQAERFRSCPGQRVLRRSPGGYSGPTRESEHKSDAKKQSWQPHAGSENHMNLGSSVSEEDCPYNDCSSLRRPSALAASVSRSAAAYSSGVFRLR